MEIEKDLCSDVEYYHAVGGNPCHPESFLNSCLFIDALAHYIETCEVKYCSLEDSVEEVIEEAFCPEKFILLSWRI
jgi:hypothetical protein